jgi:hypothetical protein
MSVAEYLALIRELASKVMAHKPGATIVLEKTPNHAMHWCDILAVFRDACFIHIIRDPRAVVASQRAANHFWGVHWASLLIADNSSSSDCVRAGREIAGAAKSYLEVRYEDLRQDGDRTLKSVFAWCGAEILREHQIDRLRSRETRGAAWPFNGPPEGFFRKVEIDSWRSDLTPGRGVPRRAHDRRPDG